MNLNLQFRRAGSFLLGALLWLSVPSQAQDRRVTGRITSASDGSALPGASVLVKGTSTGVVTDASGTYSISVRGADDVLVISSIGYQRQEVVVGSQTTINLTLTEDAGALEEVVVTGYGTQSKKDITGAVATIDTKQLLSVPATNLGQAMQGRVAGVTVGNENAPGGSVMVRIRGFGTINDNSPLYIIDGTPTKGDLNTLNLNDIESMQVLKDASAASIYGSRAGNGVVIITTKRGKAGKPRFTYDAYYGQQRPGRFLDLLNTQEYANLLWESRKNAGNVGTNGNPSHAQFGTGATPTIPDYILPGGAKEGDPRTNPSLYSAIPTSRYLITQANKEGTDWFDEIFDPAPIQNHQIGVSGGSESGRYAMSLNYFNQQGIMRYTGYKRYSVRANTEFNVTKRVRIGENFQVAYDERIGQPNGNNSESNPISFAYRIQPIIPVYDIKGYYAATSGPDLDNSRNPVAELWRNKDNVNKNVRLFGNAYAEVDILKNLTARTQFGIDYNIFTVRNYRAIDVESSEAAGSNTLNQSFNYGWTWTWYNTLTYNTSFGTSKLNVIAGTESIKSFFEFMNAGRQRFAVDDLDNRFLDAGNAGTQTNSGNASNWALASEFAKINYSLADKYLLDLTIRRDRSSRFSRANRSAIFPAVSAGWRVSGEGFMQGLTWLNDLKFRAGWGQTGNQEIGNYNSFAQFGTGPTTSFYDLNGSRTSSLQGYERTQFGNPNAKWETTTSLNVGLDGALFNNRIDFALDWYDRTTTDMLFPIEVQYTQGIATNPFQNIGEMRNRGVELGLNFHENAGRNWRFDLGLNFATYRNTVLKTTGDPLVQYFGFTTRLPPMSVTQQGYPIGSFFGYVIDGIFQTDEAARAAPPAFANADGSNNYHKKGSFNYRDVNGDGRINASDRTIIGNPHPDFSYGLNVNVAYKNLSLTLFGQGVVGNQIFNYVRYWTDFPTFGGNRSQRMYEDSWREGKTDAKLPQLRSNDNISSNPSTYYLEDGTYLRLKNVQLTYNLPAALLSKLKLGSVAVYVQGQNLLTATKYTGLDPEINLRNSGAIGQDRQIGVDEGAYPVAKSLIVGLNLSF
jgi:TonB-linked SusC/RagA family outer membrane protein